MTQPYLLQNARLLDPRLDALGPSVSILVEDGKISKVSETPLERGSATAIDLHGLTVMPGLIDAHVHIYMNEANIAALADVAPTYMAAKSSFVMKQMLHRGFTTVRDVAGGDYGMRDAVDAGFIEAPRLFIGGRAISQTGGHGDFRKRTDAGLECGCCTGLSLFSRLADGVPEIIRATREELRLGADHIKLMLSGGVASPNDPLESLQFRDDEIAAAVEEATRWGSYVCAHAYSDEAVRRATVLGVRTVEHGNFVQDETAAMMAARGTFIVPTLIVYEVNHRLGAASGKTPKSLEKNALVREAGLRSLDICRRAGVEIGFGTDLSMHTQHFQAEALLLHAQVMSNADVIRSATTVNARIVKQEGKLGEIVPGAHADLLVLDGDPYTDLRLFRDHDEKLLAVMKGGVFHKNRLPHSSAAR